MEHTYITDDAELAEYCSRAGQQDFVAIDTEFVRTRTFYPQLGLVQLYDGHEIALVDPQPINDFSPLKELLIKPSVTKVLHSCSEDLEVFWHSLSVTPAPIFDTQFAACLSGRGNTLGYAKLVEEMLQVTLDKGESRTDWTQRPLSEQQLHYAANDVHYLYQIYPMLFDELREINKEDWVTSEMAHLASKKQAKAPSEYCYLQVKNNWQLRGKQLSLLQKLAAWRLDLAREQDKALNFIIKETCMLEIARKCPQTKKNLYAVGCLNGKEIRLYSDVILTLSEEALNEDESVHPPQVMRLNDVPKYKKTVSEIRALAIDVANVNQIPLEILASKKQINQLLKWHWFDINETEKSGLRPDMLSGWRKPLLEEKLNEILGSMPVSL